MYKHVGFSFLYGFQPAFSSSSCDFNSSPLACFDPDDSNSVGDQRLHNGITAQFTGTVDILAKSLQAEGHAVFSLRSFACCGCSISPTRAPSALLRSVPASPSCSVLLCRRRHHPEGHPVLRWYGKQTKVVIKM